MARQGPPGPPGHVAGIKKKASSHSVRKTSRRIFSGSSAEIVGESDVLGRRLGTSSRGVWGAGPPAFRRHGRGFQSQSQTDHQKVRRVPNLPSSENRPISNFPQSQSSKVRNVGTNTPGYGSALVSERGQAGELRRGTGKPDRGPPGRPPRPIRLPAKRTPKRAEVRGQPKRPPRPSPGGGR